MRSFAELTSDPRRAGAARGRCTTSDIDNLEWYVGIFAEDHPTDQMMGELLTAMVGYDAFTQALTNPLLAPHVFTEATFTPVGLEIINATSSLQQIVARNSHSPESVVSSFSC